jgi:hypothetical protein
VVDALGRETVLALPARQLSQGGAEVQDVLFRDAADMDLAKARDQMLVKSALNANAGRDSGQLHGTTLVSDH